MKVSEVLTENPAAIAILIARLLSTKMQYVKNIVGSGKKSSEVITQARQKIHRGKELNPSQEQTRALAQQAQTIDDNVSYLVRRSSAGPAQGTRGPQAANQAIDDATKEITRIMKDIPIK